MNPTALILALLAQVAPTPTPPPPPPVLSTPAPSPSPAMPPQAQPSGSPAPVVFSVAPATVKLHPGATQTIAVSGATGAVQAQIDSPLATLSVDPETGTVTVTAGQQTGSATVSIGDASGASIAVPVQVAVDAGSVPPSVTVRVTGTSVDPAWLRKQITLAIGRSVQLQPGVQQPQVGAVTIPSLFAPGSSAAIPVPVTIPGGAQYFDVAATTTVDLQNVDAGPFLPPLLLYDDDPEKIVANGLLFQGQVNSSAPARLYYYHQNTGEQRRLEVVLSAASQDAASVQLIDASAGPSMDVMSVGHAVSRDFLLAKPDNQGVVVDVTPQAPYVADDFTMNPLDGAAGTIGIRLISGGPVTVSVVAVPTGTPDAGIAPYLAGPRLPGDGHHRTGDFSLEGFGTAALTYTAGGDDAEVQYGAQTPPAADPGAAGHDYGEYGVWRTLTFNVQNPGSEPATAYLYERPLGGVVRSSFLVDGQLVQMGCARLSQRYQIGQPLTLAPDGTYQVTVQTMTDGGSNYPLEVGMTATPPLPTTPPMTAPDGCFPKPQPAATPQSSPMPLPSSTPFPAPEPTG